MHLIIRERYHVRNSHKEQKVLFLRGRIMMLFVLGIVIISTQFSLAQPTNLNIYHDGWIDFNKNGLKDVYEDSKQPIERRVADLLSQMTVEEKTCQAATLYGYGKVLKDELPTKEWSNRIWKDGIANIDEQSNGLIFHAHEVSRYSYPFSKHVQARDSIQRWFVEETRLGIPVDFTNEGIHGLCSEKATPLPAPIGIGSTWNKELVRKAGQIVGREAKALGYTNVYAPILDPAQDQRWGRVVECYGEDPFLIAELGKQMCLGIQEQGVASTLKHYAVYSIPKGGRDGDVRTDPHVAPREMHQVFLYPFKRVIQEAHALGVMSSYNDWDGIPVSGSHYFLTELLRGEYGFDGYVVSDSRAVEYVQNKHHVAIDYKDAIRQVMEAGLNVRTDFTIPEDFIVPLRELVDEGKLSMKTLDKSVSEVLKVKFILGLFDHPYVHSESIVDEIVHTKESNLFADQINQESLVLLKNDENLLPLDKTNINRILVTGPLAKARGYMTSRYGPQNNEVVSVFDGISNYLGNKVNVDYAQGCDVVDATWPESEIIPTELTTQEQELIDEAVSRSEKADVIIAVVGEDEKRVGESLSRTSLELPGRQSQLIKALYKTGKPIVLVLINGRPLSINWENRYIPAILEAWFPGPSGGRVIAKALFGDYNPGGKLSITFPKTVGQIPQNFPYKPSSQTGQPKEGMNGYGKTRVFGALYPFGYGLSYTTFKYDHLMISPQKQNSRGIIDVSCEVSNTGEYTGDEVVQLYIKDVVSSVIVYEMQLRGFERIRLEPGEMKKVAFQLKPSDLELLDKNMNWIVEPGLFKVLIGSSSTDIRLMGDFEILPE